MTRLIELEDLSRLEPSDASYLGPDLARWWFPRDWREAARLPAPPVELQPGTALALCVWKDPGPAWVTHGVDGTQRGQPVRGVPLPVRWVQARGHDGRLPEGFAAAADRAFALERETFRGGTEPWRLELASELGDVDLSRLRVGAESAMVSFIAALRLARLGVQAAPRVVATGCVDDAGRIRNVAGETLRDKVELCKALAEGWGAEVGCFVPSAQLSAEAVTDLQFPLVRLRTLAWQDQPKLAVALAPFLAELDAEPSSPPVLPFDPETDAHVAWANRDHILFDARREVHYLRYIVAPLSRFQGERSGLEPTARLATAVGMFPSPVALAALVHGARAVCLVTTAKSVSAAARAIVALLQQDPDLVVHEVRQQHSVSLREAVDGASAGSFAAWADAHLTTCNAVSDGEAVSHIAEWLREGETGRVDITAGRAIVSAILVAAARKAKSEVYYLGHKQKGSTPLYGTEWVVPAPWATS